MTSHRMTAGCLLAAAGLLAASWGCSKGPARIKPPAINASAAGAKALEMYDADKDGKLNSEELDECPALRSAVARIDPTGEGVTAAKITARIEVWQRSRAALLSVSCQVLHNGVPLAGAEVKFVPEKFLGENVKTAMGKTDENGMTWPTVPLKGPAEHPGLAPGFYRIEVTKPGLSIPAKYNTATTLGEEIAGDCQKLMMGGVACDLKF